jgi:hypothetical protein
MEDFTIVNKAVVLCAKRNSGKSYLCRHLVNLYREHFCDIFVISTTECSNGFYSSFVNEKNIFTEFSSEWLEKFYTRVQENYSKDKKKYYLLILDDCGAEVDYKKDKTLNKIFTRGRHIGLSVMVLQQYLYQIQPVCRGNCDYLIIGQSNQASVEILAKEFCQGHITKRDFIKMYHQSSSDYYFLVINNSSVKDNSDLNSIYGKVKAP